MNYLLNAAERLANDAKAPARLVDWANGMYDRMTDNSDTVYVWELLCLFALAEDYDNGCSAIDYALTIREVE